MQDKALFEYAVIRVVPRVEREEFLNVGVIVYCAKQKFLQAMFVLDEERLLHFSNKIAVHEIREHLCAFEQICIGSAEGETGDLHAFSLAHCSAKYRGTNVTGSSGILYRPAGNSRKIISSIGIVSHS